MSRLRKIAEIPAGSWTKWLVVGLWLVVIVLAFPLSSKLTGAEKNDASAWLPGSAESTKVLDVQAHFQSPNVYPGVVIYLRPSGLTAADRAKAASDARMFAGLPHVVPGSVTGPIPSADGTALQTILKADLPSARSPTRTRTAWSLTSPARSGTRPTTTTCSRASTARCCIPPWRSSS
jgi:RND superfamily putative drug exporter